MHIQVIIPLPQIHLTGGKKKMSQIGLKHIVHFGDFSSIYDTEILKICTRCDNFVTIFHKCSKTFFSFSANNNKSNNIQQTNHQ